ncbi:hypothetical protein, partial [Kineococcus glutinatus]|uniref:hypothetical protein n=1 Tax=Kineococcus glutinatus TaxID=1070872 RepID=UPI0031EB43F0
LTFTGLVVGAIYSLFALGYTYDDAVALAALWNSPTPSDAKATAGLKILEGEELPIPPGGEAATAEQVLEQQRLDAFFEAGYDHDDAVALAELWQVADVGEVKVTAGRKLLEDLALPIAPGSAPEAPAPPPSAEDRALEAFFAAAYGYDDAVALAALWNSPTPYDAKVTAGQKILDDLPLPFPPGGETAPDGGDGDVPA